MIDIQKNLHMSSFPTKIASMMVPEGGKVYNIVITDNKVDNGQLCGRGTYVSFDQYEQDAVPSDTGTPAVTFAGVIRELGADGKWIIEVTQLPKSGEVLYMYNSPVSEYDEFDLQDEALFYSKQGERIQGARLDIGDLFSISPNGFEGNDPADEAAVTYNETTHKYTVA